MTTPSSKNITKKKINELELWNKEYYITSILRYLRSISYNQPYIAVSKECVMKNKVVYIRLNSERVGSFVVCRHSNRSSTLHCIG